MGGNKKRKLRSEEEELPSTSYPLSPSPTPSTSTSTSEHRNWAELPELVLHSILTRLLTSNPDLTDFLSFSSVCRSWKSTSATSPTSFPPLLLLPNPILSFAPLQTLLTGRTFKSKIPPETLTLPFLGCSNGRLIFFSDRNPLLADVFTGELTRIRPLPPPFDDFHHVRLALLADQDLLLLISKYLLFSLRPGTDSWSSLAITDPSQDIVSVAFHQGKLFALDSMWRLMVVDLGGGKVEIFMGGLNLMEVATAEEPLEEHGIRNSTFFDHRLVECGGELLLLRQNMLLQFPPLWCRITVYRLDFERSVWVRTESLGDWCIFLDTMGYFPVACSVPARWGGRSNCIYFVGMGHNNWVVTPLDEDFFISDHYLFNPVYTRPKPTPVWVYPSLLFSGTSN